MKLSAPKLVTWWISVILGVLALIGVLNVVPALGGFAIWMALVGLALLALGSALKGL